MGMIRMVRKSGKYIPGGCVNAGCNGSFRFSNRDRKYWCTRCGQAVPALPTETTAANVKDIRWDGRKWYFLKQKKLK